MYKTVQVIKILSMSQILAMRFQFATYSLKYYSCQAYWYFDNVEVRKVKFQKNTKS